MRAFEHARISLNDKEKELLGLIVRESSLCFSDRLNDVYLVKMNKSGGPFRKREPYKAVI